jgi:hypothetical protein
MSEGRGFPTRQQHLWQITPCQWTGPIAVFLIALSLVGSPASADEFDALLAYKEAKPLNDAWQACAASYVKPRLRTKQSANELSGRALRRCRSQESSLRRFLVGRIGRRSAANVIQVLRRKYQSDLAAAVDALRTRE